jgi:hypothetical protein
LIANCVVQTFKVLSEDQRLPLIDIFNTTGSKVKAPDGLVSAPLRGQTKRDTHATDRLQLGARNSPG